MKRVNGVNTHFPDETQFYKYNFPIDLCVHLQRKNFKLERMT
ncbi:hypothetical protein BMS3Abin05_02262 [bacterium BMS3Abin05]|nr:hypothetical protein BMS3Abin05_02262 [bacterium BMS3Abin05]GBE28702.1 hypothetical protein BMS3Bbin03_02652 [bacterium BMS3Bbin03]